jgi:hypothetical protein
MNYLEIFTDITFLLKPTVFILSQRHKFKERMTDCYLAWKKLENAVSLNYLYEVSDQSMGIKLLQLREAYCLQDWLHTHPKELDHLQKSLYQVAHFYPCHVTGMRIIEGEKMLETMTRVLVAAETLNRERRRTDLPMCLGKKRNELADLVAALRGQTHSLMD